MACSCARIYRGVGSFNLWRWSRNFSEIQQQQLRGMSTTTTDGIEQRSTKVTRSDLRSFGMKEHEISRILNLYKDSPKLHTMVQESRISMENLGIDKKAWSKILPNILKYNNMEKLVNFLTEECGVEKESLGKVIAKCPMLIADDVEKKLKPTLSYLKDLGVKVSEMIVNDPRILRYSINDQINPVVEFWLENGMSKESLCRLLVKHSHVVTYKSAGDFKGTLDFFTQKGFTKKEISVILTRLPQILSLSVSNVAEKWEYFMSKSKGENILREDILRFPPCFGYSLEKRIKPRYEFVMKNKIDDWNWPSLLIPSHSVFHKKLERKLGRREFQSLQQQQQQQQEIVVA